MSSVEFKFPPKDELIPLIKDLSRPLPQRMRSIFYLRTLGGEDSVAALCEALANKAGSTLFRHEIAYVLGQMQAKSAIPRLLSVLGDTTDDPIVRHESGEALGAIADPSTLAALDTYSNDERPEVSETCQIAARRVRWVLEHGTNGSSSSSSSSETSTPSSTKDTIETLEENPYESIDPAPAKKRPENIEVPAIQKQLVDQSLPLFERYKAMFSLRNNGSRGAVLALCTGLKDPSPLFRHEVAYVLGQLMHPASIDALKLRIQDNTEHEMVRHEAAEALGAIGNSDCVEFLQKYAADSAVMLRESCEIALDVVDYWANTTTKDDTISGETSSNNNV